MFNCPRGTDSYTIQPGDSLWAIARHFNTTMQSIKALNPMLNEYNLNIGQVICIPQNGKCYSRPMQQLYNCVSIEEQELGEQLRLLWEQHVYWTRFTILSIVLSLPDEEAVVC